MYNSLWLILTSIICILMVIQFYIKTHFTRRARALNKYSGATIFPFLGNANKFLGPSYKIQENISEYFQKYGRVCRFWMLGEPKLLVADASACAKILSSTVLVEKGVDYENLRDHLGNGLVTSQGERWRRDRKLLQFAFNRQLFDGFLQIFNKDSRILVEKLGLRFQQNKVPKNLYPNFISAAMDMIFEAALGIDIKIQAGGEDNDYAKAIHILVKTSTNRLFKPWLLNPILYALSGQDKIEKRYKDILLRACRHAVNRQEKELQNKTNDNDADKTRPFLDALMESTPPPTEQDYSDHLLTIVAAGAETTASSIHQTLFFLALYPEHQRKCQEEVDNILRSDPDRDIVMADLSEAKYLERCWKESMRIRPPVPVLSRRITHDITLDDGSVVPKDTDAVFFVYDLHRDSRMFPDPERFDPDRFTPEACATRSAYSYIPFSMGIRNCIGLRYANMEAQVTLIQVLSKFDISTKQKQEDIKTIFGVPGEPYPNIELALHPRHTTGL